jgi:hypothetical protein
LGLQHQLSSTVLRCFQWHSCQAAPHSDVTTLKEVESNPRF